MKQLILGLSIGLAIGLTLTGCSLAKGFITAEPLQVVMTDRNHVTTTPGGYLSNIYGREYKR